MIKEVTMYTVVCDNCGHTLDDGDYSCYSDAGYARDNAMDSDWHEEGSRHYCPDCFFFDDNDKLILTPKP